MMLKVSIFSAWMIIVQIIGFGSSFFNMNGHTGRNVHSPMHVIDSAWLALPLHGVPSILISCDFDSPFSRPTWNCTLS